MLHGYQACPYHWLKASGRDLRLPQEPKRTCAPRAVHLKLGVARPNQVMKSLLMGGFFKLPNKRTKDEVVRAFEAKGTSTEGKGDNTMGILTRRVNKGTLRSAKGSNGLVYWPD
jgi:hypothetical protein